MAIGGLALLVASFAVAAVSIVAFHYGRLGTVELGHAFVAASAAIVGTVFTCMAVLLTAFAGPRARLGGYGQSMHHATLGPFADVSRLTLGGGGLGLVWGESTEDEAIATVRAAVAAGINLIDTAPMYGACEAVIAATFDGVLPAGVRGDDEVSARERRAPDRGEPKLEQSLDASLEAMRLASCRRLLPAQQHLR